MGCCRHVQAISSRRGIRKSSWRRWDLFSSESIFHEIFQCVFSAGRVWWRNTQGRLYVYIIIDTKYYKARLSSQGSQGIATKEENKTKGEVTKRKYSFWRHIKCFWQKVCFNLLSFEHLCTLFTLTTCYKKIWTYKVLWKYNQPKNAHKVLIVHCYSSNVSRATILPESHSRNRNNSLFESYSPIAKGHNKGIFFNNGCLLMSHFAVFVSFQVSSGRF